MTAGTGAALLFAFLGGLILNLMPCVFPVLSLKLLDLVQGAHQSQRLVGHGLAFTGGVLLSMVLLSGTLMALRTAGHAVGWGFQLQSPWVVAALILLFGAITCNLLGLYEFTFGSRAADLKVVRSLPQSGITSSFFSGPGSAMHSPSPPQKQCSSSSRWVSAWQRLGCFCACSPPGPKSSPNRDLG